MTFTLQQVRTSVPFLVSFVDIGIKVNQILSPPTKVSQNFSLFIKGTNLETGVPQNYHYIIHEQTTRIHIDKPAR